MTAITKILITNEIFLLKMFYYCFFKEILLKREIEKLANNLYLDKEKNEKKEKKLIGLNLELNNLLCKTTELRNKLNEIN